jgi:ABC-type sugar transport system permease subunit
MLPFPTSVTMLLDAFALSVIIVQWQQTGTFFVIMLAGHKAVVDRSQEAARHLCLIFYNAERTL